MAEKLKALFRAAFTRDIMVDVAREIEAEYGASWRDAADQQQQHQHGANDDLDQCPC